MALLLFAQPAWPQADYAREQRWAQEITPALLVGDPIRLEAAGRKFLAIYAPAAGPVAGVVVIHGLGVHPDWGLINPLRSDLSEQGYSTLSIQMPVLAAGRPGSEYQPLFPEAAERIARAVAFLRERGHARVALVAHSLGARMANEYFNRIPGAQVDAWVAIGLSGAFTRPETIRAPVLDLHGEHDLPAVLKAAGERAAALRAISGSAQAVVPSADHFFNGMERELVRRVKAFLDARFGR